MDKKLERQVKKYEEMLTKWALEQKLINPGQEVKIRARIRKRVPVKRWKLMKEEWDTILSLPWTESKRTLLEILKKSRGKPLAMKEIRLSWQVKWSRLAESPSDTSYYGINTSLVAAKLPFHISCYYDASRNRMVRMAAISYRP